MTLRVNSIHLFSVVLIVILASFGCRARQVMDRNFNQEPPKTLTELTTLIQNQAKTTTVLTAKICAKNLATSICRRKRSQFWMNLPGSLLQDPDINAYFRHQLSSPVIKLEPTQLFRSSSTPILSSFDDLDDENDSNNNQPIFYPEFPISSSIKPKLVTLTSTVLLYPSTVTVSVYSTTKTFTIDGCLPPGVSITDC